MNLLSSLFLLASLALAPYLQRPSSDGFTVCLEAPDDSALELAYAAEGSSGRAPFVFRKFEASGTYFAYADVKGLKPDTDYAWQVVRGGDVVGRGNFRTWKTGGADDFSCAVFGDFQTGLTPSDWEADPLLCGAKMFADMVENKVDFAITTGDLADRGDYAKEIKPLILERTCGILGARVPFFTAWGNHDTKHPQNHFFLRNPTETSFAFEKNGCLFVCIDDGEVGNDKIPGSTALRTWFAGLMDSEAARKAKFRFVFQHVPVYCEEFGNCNRWLADLYEKYGVDAVFSGDHHGYAHIERGGLVQVVNGNMGYFKHVNGFVNWYGDEVKMGGSHGMCGKKWRFQQPGKPGKLGPPTPIYGGNFPGYGILSVKGDVATFSMQAFNADGSKIGEVDRFELKSRRGEAPVRKPKGMATEFYCFSEKPVWTLKYTLTGKGGAELELLGRGARVIAYRVPDGKGGLKDILSRHPTIDGYIKDFPDDENWKGETFHEGDVVGVRFTKDGARRVIRLFPDNSYGPVSASDPLVLDSLFQDGLVFSAAHPVRVTGTARVGAEVKVSLQGRTSSAKAGEDGRFLVEFAPLGVVKEPFAVTVTDGTTTKILRDCLSGLVLLAGGQSNMEVPVKEALDPESEAASADWPLIREFKVVHDFDFMPRERLSGRWTRVSPAVAPNVGAIGYYTARRLHKELGGVPVGIINNAVSATPIESWLPEAYLTSDKKFARYFWAQYRRFRQMGRERCLAYRQELGRSFLVADEGNEGEAKGWHRGAQADWKDIAVPGWLEAVWGDSSDGAFWFAREVEIPADWAGKDIEFRTTAIDDYDVTYFNGEKIGQTGEETPDPYDAPRAYRIPGRLVKAGRNVISVRVFDSAHAGGLCGEQILLAGPNGAEIDLKGTWKTAAERILKAKNWPEDYLPLVKIDRNGATLYNALMHPLKGTAVDAVLWYQGESNAGQPLYGEMFRELITQWRKDLGLPEVPFVFMQLAAFQGRPKDAWDVGSWPLTRNLQAEALQLTNVRMVPTIDIGDAHRIHPLNKQEVGRRAALVLLQDFWAKDRFAGTVSYPEVVSVSRKGDKVVVELKNAAGLKTTDGRAPQSFAVAGTFDRTLRRIPAHWVKAEIEGERVVLTLPPEMPRPKSVRYAQHMNPDVNTVNALGFPLLPFEMNLPEEGE